MVRKQTAIAFLVLIAAGLCLAARNGARMESRAEYSIFAETMVDMTWLEVERAAKTGAIVLLPVGVVEEHGPHMCLGSDIYMTYLPCKLARRALAAKGIEAVVAPPFYWGINVATGAYPGSFTVRRSTMEALLIDTFACLKKWGFKKVFVLNGHGDTVHKSALNGAVAEANAGGGLDVAVIRAPMAYEGPKPRGWDYHAGAVETSMMAGAYPDLVDADLARTLEPEADFAAPAKRRGYVGDPAAFDAAAGRKAVEAYGKAIAAWIEAYLEKK